MKRAALLSTALIIIPTITQAQCVATTDCASLGYTETSCSNGGLKCPFGNTWSCKTTSTATETPTTATLGTCTGYAKNCTIGQILNSDGTCTSTHVSSKTPIGIVVAVKNNCGWAMAPHPVESRINWAEKKITYDNAGNVTGSTLDYPDIGIPRSTSSQTIIADYDSCGNTQKIIQSGTASAYPAAWAAYEYAPAAAPATKGKWCLPSAGILNNLYLYRSTISSAFSRIGGTGLIDNSNHINEHIWSSSEYDKYSVWIYCTYGENGIDHRAKNFPEVDENGRTFGDAVRPVIMF